MAITGGGSGGAIALDDLTDVVITSPTLCNVLHYDGAIWENLDSTTDWLSQYLYLPGRTGGQHIGAGTKPTGGNVGDVSSYNRLYLGETVSEVNAYITNRILDLRKDIDISSLGSATLDSVRFLFNLVASGTVAANNHDLFTLRLSSSGTPGLTSGSFAVTGFNFPLVIDIPSGVTCSSLTGFSFNPQINGIGTITTDIGVVAAAAGGGSAGGTVNTLVGVESRVSSFAAVVTNLYAFRATILPGATPAAAVTQVTAFEVSPTFMNDADVVTWSGLRIGAGITAAIANKWALDLTNTSVNMGSRVAHPIALGWNPATVSLITARAMLAIGTTTASPLKFQAGTNLTTPAKGATEFDGIQLFFTPDTLRKVVNLSDSVPAGSIVYGDASGQHFIALPNGTLNDVLKSGGGTNPPFWAAGGAGGGGTYNQAEIDFGATPVAEAEFTVIDAGVGISSRITGSVAYEAPTGKDLDELEMDGLDLKFGPGSGQLKIYARGMDGYVHDKFKINYTYL